MANKSIHKQDTQVYGFLFLSFLFLIIGLIIQNVVAIGAGITMLLFMIYRELFETGWEDVKYTMSSEEYLKARKKRKKKELIDMRARRDAWIKRDEEEEFR